MAAAYPVSGKIALVTGAARGIGYEAARRLRDRGASVALIDLDSATVEAAATTLGERAIGLAADVTDAAAMRATVDAVVENFGGLDIVVANAGIAPQSRPMTVADNDAFERVIEIDLLGVWRTVQPALAQVAERRGHIVVVASIFAFVNGMMAAPYAMSKAGVEQLGRALRAELSIHGASASVAYFGFIGTEMTREVFSDPVGRRTREVLPDLLTSTLHPAVAGTAIVDGIERRAARVFRPRWWRVASALRGLLNPLLDRRMLTDEQMMETLAEAERLGSADR